VHNLEQRRETALDTDDGGYRPPAVYMATARAVLSL